MNSRLISIYEDTSYKLDFTRAEIEELLSLKKVIGKNNLKLEADGSFMVSHYVGFLATKKIKLQVLPKILNLNSNIYERNYELENKAISLLFNMMNYCEYLEVRELPDEREVNELNGDILEIFISIFNKSLLEKLKKGINKSYVEKEENSIFIKGKILVSETKRKNSYREHFHYLRYEEFTPNNLLNRIFKTVAIKLLSISKNKANIRQLRVIIETLNEADIINITKDTFKNIKFNRLNNQFQKPFRLAEILFFSAMPGLYNGNRDTYSFLIQVNQLYERFLYKWIKNELKKRQKYEVFYQKPQRYLVAEDEMFLLKPDITINKGKAVSFIIDAKYKNINKKINQNDIYQMITYAIRYNCENIYLVYPKMLDSDSKSGVINEYSIKSKLLKKEIKIRICIFDLFDYKKEKVENYIN